MADNKPLIEQQVKDKIKSYNKQRTVLVIAIVGLIGILIFSPVLGIATIFVRLSVFCSAVLLLSGTAFIPHYKAHYYCSLRQQVSQEHCLD